MDPRPGPRADPARRWSRRSPRPRSRRPSGRPVSRSRSCVTPFVRHEVGHLGHLGRARLGVRREPGDAHLGEVVALREVAERLVADDEVAVRAGGRAGLPLPVEGGQLARRQGRLVRLDGVLRGPAQVAANRRAGRWRRCVVMFVGSSHTCGSRGRGSSPSCLASATSPAGGASVGRSPRPRRVRSSARLLGDGLVHRRLEAARRRGRGRRVGDRGHLLRGELEVVRLGAGRRSGW